MSEDLISRYKQSFRVSFRDANTEAKYREMQQQRGQDSSVFAFAALFLICLVFAYLELRAFGHEVAIPMYGYLLATLLALVNLLISRVALETSYHQLRLVTNGLLAMATVVGAVFLQKYSAYHVIEFVLLVVWLGSLKTVRMVSTLVLNVLFVCAFVAVMYTTDTSDIPGFRMLLVSVLLAAAVMLAAYLGYLAERARRLLFLQIEANHSMNRRQELWSFTLIDLDTALSGIVDFKEVIALLKKYLEPVIEFESYVLTSLEGQGPKPVADQIGGELFESDVRTLWSEELLGKLTQTRQATVSAEHEMVKNVLGRKKQRFTSYRLDVPVFSDSRLLGIISLRRESEPFDRLDMIASVSIAAQAMLIFKRSTRTQKAPVTPTVVEPVIRPKPVEDTTRSKTAPISTTEDKDMEMTDHSFSESSHNLIPKDVITKFKLEQASAKKTITLMSRENADKIAVDRYRTAAVESQPLSVLIIEVDGLSKLREEDGDEVAYKVFAAIVKYIFSKVDKEKEILGRYGQNGLSVLMPQVDMNAAERFAEMIRQFVQAARYKTAYGEKSATLSIGVAALTDDTGDYASMVKRADMALFVAKKNGRNCVKVRL
ncbi:GGDEF domain-containing protein [Gammaproteobacteria bacterium]|nr:GGDEF domain-containing protein [Gammaproteobacteria bacterium]